MKTKSMMGICLLGAIASGCQAIAPIGPLDNAPIAPTLDPHSTSHISARVTRVVSGHTIEIQPSHNPDTLNQTVRLIGIQAPAWNQTPWGPESKAHLEHLLLGQTIHLSFDDAIDSLNQPDSYGRQWAYVWLNGKLVNQLLIADGMALDDGRSPHRNYVQSFAHAQHRARIMGLGIWNPDHPMRQTPNEFRQQQD